MMGERRRPRSILVFSHKISSHGSCPLRVTFFRGRHRHLPPASIGDGHKELLRAERSPFFRRTHIVSTRCQQPSLHIVYNVSPQNLLAKTQGQPRIFDWIDDLASLHQVSGHPVGPTAVTLLSPPL